MIEDFIRHIAIEKRYSSRTVAAYQTDLTQFLAFLIDSDAQATFQTVTHGVARAWIVALAEDHQEPRSINRKIASLRAFYKFLLKQGFVEKNPMTKIRILKTAKALPHFIKEQDMEELLRSDNFDDSFQSLRDRVILELLYGTGIRRAELVGLKETDIDWRGNCIRVLGKRNKERIIPFSKSLLPIVQSYREAKNRLLDRGEHGRLLVTDTGAPIYPALVNRIVTRKLERFPQLEKKNPHIMRHSYATHLLNQGADLNAVKDLLGHSSLAATQVYTHNSIDKLKKVFEKAHPKA